MRCCNVLCSSHCYGHWAFTRYNCEYMPELENIWIERVASSKIYIWVVAELFFTYRWHVLVTLNVCACGGWGWVIIKYVRDCHCKIRIVNNGKWNIDTINEPMRAIFSFQLKVADATEDTLFLINRMIDYYQSSGRLLSDLFFCAHGIKL